MLEGKIALVTGASRGIGRQIAKTLAAKGAFVIVNYNGSAAKAEEVVKEIQAAGGNGQAVQCNVSDFESCKEMLDAVVKEHGRLDILVNNAGITRDNLLMKMSEEDFDAVIQTQLKGRVQLHPSHCKTDVKAEERPHHQHFFCIRCIRKCRTGKLLCSEGRRHRTDQECSKRAGKPRHYCKCSCTRIY